MFDRITAVFSLLTIIPTSANNDLEKAARSMWAFPLVGLVIGAIAGGIGAGLFELGLPSLLVGALTAATLLVITGMHHLDGLADLADALMAKKSRERKLEILKESTVGVAGVGTVGIYLLVLVGSIYWLGSLEIFATLIVGEVASKIAMVIVIRTGNVSEQSSAAPFAKAAKSARLVIATVSIGAVIAYLVGSISFYEWGVFVAMGGGIVAALIVAKMATSSLGSLRGDAIGASGEIARLATMVILVGLR